MAMTLTNRGMYVLGTDDASALDLRVATFLGAVPAVATIRDWNFLSEVSTTESSNVARQDVTGVTLTEQDGTDSVEWRGDAMVVNSVAAGETLTHVVWYKFNASDAAAEIIGVDEPAATLVTNGGNVTLPAFSVDISQA